MPSHGWTQLQHLKLVRLSHDCFSYSSSLSLLSCIQYLPSFKGDFFCVWERSSSRQHGKVNIDKDSILPWSRSWAGKGIITELGEEKPAESLWLVKKRNGSREEQEQTGKVTLRPNWWETFLSSCCWGCDHSSEVPGNRSFSQTTCPSPSSHPTMSILLLERLHWSH